MSDNKYITQKEINAVIKKHTLEDYVFDLIQAENQKQVDDFILRFIEYMGAAESLEKCNAGGIKLVMDMNGDRGIKENEIKILHTYVKARLDADKERKNPLHIGMSKQEAISRLNHIVNTSKDEKLVIETIKQLTTLNDWLNSSDAEEIIKSNNAVIETINKCCTQKEIEYLAFDFVAPEVSNIPNENESDDEDESESIITNVEIIDKV